MNAAMMRPLLSGPPDGVSWDYCVGFSLLYSIYETE